MAVGRCELAERPEECGMVEVWKSQRLVFVDDFHRVRRMFLMVLEDFLRVLAIVFCVDVLFEVVDLHPREGGAWRQR